MSSCNCLSMCLEEIREWSDAHPTHHILFIEIELKLTGDFLQVRMIRFGGSFSFVLPVIATPPLFCCSRFSYLFVLLVLMLVLPLVD